MRDLEQSSIERDGGPAFLDCLENINGEIGTYETRHT